MSVEICSQHTMPVYKMSMCVCSFWISVLCGQNLRLSIKTAYLAVSSNTKTNKGSGWNEQRVEAVPVLR